MHRVTWEITKKKARNNNTFTRNLRRPLLPLPHIMPLLLLHTISQLVAIPQPRPLHFTSRVTMLLRLTPIPGTGQLPTIARSRNQVAPSIVRLRPSSRTFDALDAWPNFNLIN